MELKVRRTPTVSRVPPIETRSSEFTQESIGACERYRRCRAIADIQMDTADLATQLDRVPPSNPGQIVDDGISAWLFDDEGSWLHGAKARDGYSL